MGARGSLAYSVPKGQKPVPYSSINSPAGARTIPSRRKGVEEGNWPTPENKTRSEKMRVNAPKTTKAPLVTIDTLTSSGARSAAATTKTGKTNKSRNPDEVRKLTSPPTLYEIAGVTYPPYQLE
jgi:hypothetical protein